MSTLTKVFTVLLAIFSIAFTTMAVSMAVQVTDWRETAQKYDEHARVADANLRNLIAATSAELASAQETIQGHLGEITRLKGEAQASRNELAQFRADLARADSEKSGAEAINRGLLAQLSACGAARDEFRTQRDELERRGIDLERRNIDLNDRVNEQTAQIAVLLEQKRQFEQQINILRGEGERVAGVVGAGEPVVSMEAPAGAAISQVTALTPAMRSPIRGHVVDVNGNIITISVGAADGIKKDMVFVVHRNDEYIGDLKIDLVDPNQSAGRPVGPPFVPRPGDQVTDSLAIGSSRG